MSRPVSVVVPTRSRADRVLAAVEPLLGDPAVLEVLVVVDGSRDGSLEILQDRARTAPALRPVWQEHAGPGAARHRGAAEARGEIVLLLDDDVVPPPGLASGHAAAHAEHPGHVVVGALVTPPAARGVDAVTTDLYRAAWDHCQREYERSPDRILEHLWLGNVSMPRTAALHVGLDDPEMGALFFEDRDLGLRLRAHGVPAVFRSDLAVRHDHRRALAAFRDDALRQGRALGILHRRYPDLVPEPTARWIAGRAPLPARLIVAAAAGDAWIGGALSGLLLGLARTLGLLRGWRLQHLVVVLLQRAGQATGVASAATGPSRWRAPAVPAGAAELLLPAGPPEADPALRSGRTTTYVTRRAWSGATALVPAGDRGLAAAVRGRGPTGVRRQVRRALAETVHGVRGRPAVTIAARPGEPPAAVAAALGPDAPPAALVLGGGGPRRRAAFLVPGAGADVKVDRGPDGPGRAAHEQDVLTRLHALGVGGPVPRPLGHGAAGPLSWSAESAAAGVPLAEVLADTSPSGRARARAVLERVTVWLADVASATRSDPRPGLAPVPAVLQHGDLATALNVLVDGRSFAVIDWETAAWDGTPLADALPLLCAGLAAGRGGPGEQAEYVLRLCEGRVPESAWLFGALRRYCRGAAVPTTHAGRLAALAFDRQAAMQGAHRGLVTAAGGHAGPWESMWPEVAAGWGERPRLGTRWTALGEA